MRLHIMEIRLQRGMELEWSSIECDGVPLDGLQRGSKPGWSRKWLEVRALREHSIDSRESAPPADRSFAGHQIGVSDGD
jgi:hypothetical protein